MVVSSTSSASVFSLTTKTRKSGHREEHREVTKALEVTSSLPFTILFPPYYQTFTPVKTPLTTNNSFLRS